MFSMAAGAGGAAARKVPNWALAGLLAVFVGGTYFKAINRVTSDDLERELERELEEEARRQQREQQKK